MRLIILVLLLPLLLSGCGSLRQEKITVTGTALNAKAGAVVQTGTDTYYIDGIQRWDEETYGKTVIVNGLLRTVHHQPSSDGVIRQEMRGTQKIIRNPQWKIQ